MSTVCEPGSGFYTTLKNSVSRTSRKAKVFELSVRLGVACRQRTRLKYSSFLSPLLLAPPTNEILLFLFFFYFFIFPLFYFISIAFPSILRFSFGCSFVRTPSDDAFILTRPPFFLPSFLPSFLPFFLPSFLPSCTGCCHVRFVIQRVRRGVGTRDVELTLRSKSTVDKV